jgi:hypothetical protein
MKTLIVAAVALLMPGCVSIGYHSRKIADMKQADYEYALALAQKVKLGEMRPQDMVTRLKWRYRIQEEAGQ